MNVDAHAPGILFVVGLGPGSPGLLTPDAAAAIAAAETVVGYHGYLALIEDRLAGKAIVGRELGEEVERARTALRLADEGQVVALVSSGDAGIYGMGGVACELAAREQSAAEVVLVPGVTAACAAAARLGAPLAHDWACISLSDLLTPWDVIVRRVEAAARADFVMVLYNPASRTRRQQLTRVAERLLAFRPGDTPVGLVENAYRPGERVEIISLRDLAEGRTEVTMFTILIVGSSRTFVADRKMITPRIYAAKTEDPEVSSIARAPGQTDAGARIMEQSLAIIDREMGARPADSAERAILRRVIHASADFDFLTTFRFGPCAIAGAVDALRRGAPVITDVEMLRAGIRRDLAGPLGVEVLCALNDPKTATLVQTSDSLTRSAAGIRLAAAQAADGAVVAIGNAPTALDEAVRLIEASEWRPACVIGVPVGFVGVKESKERLLALRGVPTITSVGRKGGTAVTAAVVNALLELAAARREGDP
jgi:precorrin-3B C17-methyltransferase